MKNKSPLISVIVPAFNTSAFLCECLDSILTQSFQDLEVICIDDCSTDHTPEILARYEKTDGRVRIIRHASNMGLSAARNSGIDAAAGTYLLFLDSDDYLLPGSIRKMADTMLQNHLDLLLFGREDFRLDDTAGLTILPKRGRTASTNQIMSGAELLDLQVQQHEFNPVVWTQLVSSRLLKESGLRFFPGILHEDELYTPLLMELSKCAMCIADKFVMHRIHSASIMGAGVTYKTIDGYFVGFCTLMARYLEGSCQVSGIAERAKCLYRSAFAKYHSLPDEERQKVGKQIPELYRYLFESSNFICSAQLTALEVTLKENAMISARLEQEISRLQADNSAMLKDLSDLEHSLSFRIGRCITFIPRKIRKLLQTVFSKTG